MEPIEFKEANKNLLKPSIMTDEECKNLPVFSNGERCISKWKMNLRERFHCLFRGYIWLGIRSGQTQPPVYLSAEKSVFEEN